MIIAPKDGGEQEKEGRTYQCLSPSIMSLLSLFCATASSHFLDYQMAPLPWDIGLFYWQTNQIYDILKFRTFSFRILCCLYFLLENYIDSVHFAHKILWMQKAIVAFGLDLPVKSIKPIVFLALFPILQPFAPH